MALKNLEKSVDKFADESSKKLKVLEIKFFFRKLLTVPNRCLLFTKVLSYKLQKI